MTSIMELDFDSHSLPEATTSSTCSSLTVHRLRFPDWTPSSITSLAFPPTHSINPTHPSVQSNNTNTRSILAIGRENGNVELYVWVGPNREDSHIATGSTSTSSDTQNHKGWVVHTVSTCPVLGFSCILSGKLRGEQSRTRSGSEREGKKKKHKSSQVASDSGIASKIEIWPNCNPL